MSGSRRRVGVEATLAVRPAPDRAAAMGDAIEDEGVRVTGLPVSVEGVTSRGSFFVGLGPPTPGLPAPRSPRRFVGRRPEHGCRRKPAGRLAFGRRPAVWPALYRRAR